MEPGGSGTQAHTFNLSREPGQGLTLHSAHIALRCWLQDLIPYSRVYTTLLRLQKQQVEPLQFFSVFKHFALFSMLRMCKVCVGSSDHGPGTSGVSGFSRAISQTCWLANPSVSWFPGSRVCATGYGLGGTPFLQWKLEVLMRPGSAWNVQCTQGKRSLRCYFQGLWADLPNTH